MSELLKLINTLKKDNTNPLINKDVIIKAFEAAEKASPHKYEYDESIDNVDGATLEMLEAGDTLITGGVAYIVIYASSTSRAMLTIDLENCSYTQVVYTKSGDSWLDQPDLFGGTIITDNNCENVMSDKDVKVKTIEQSNANWSASLPSLNLYTPSGFSATNLFCRLQKINQELEIIFTFTVTNTGGSSATPANVQCDFIELPTNIAEKIIDVNGKKLTEDTANLSAIAAAPLVCYAAAPANVDAFIHLKGVMSLSHTTNKKLYIGMYELPEIGAGGTVTFTGRIQLTLL